MVYRFRNYYIREEMMATLQRYIQHGLDPGHFLRAVIDNDLEEAVSRADDENLRNLPAFVAYLYNEAPAPCWGSPERRRTWTEARRATSGELAPVGGEEEG